MRWLACIAAANGGKWSLDQELRRVRFARTLLVAPDPRNNEESGPKTRFFVTRRTSRLLQQQFLPSPATDDAPDLVAVGGTLVGRRERPFDLLEDNLLALFGPLRT